MHDPEHSFKKPDGGRGRPSPTSNCYVCGIIYTEHYKPARKVLAKAKKAKPRSVEHQGPRPVARVGAKPSTYWSGPETRKPPAIPEPFKPRIRDPKREAHVAKVMKDAWISIQMTRFYPGQGDFVYWSERYEQEVW